MPKKLRRLLHKLSDVRQRHHERHRPSGFGFAFADRVGYLDSVRWDALTARSSFFLQRPFLETLEAAGPENIEPRYALVFHDREPVAALAVPLVTVFGERMLKPKAERLQKDSVSSLLKRALLPAAHKVSSGVRERVLVCGNLLSWGFHGVAFAPGLDAVGLWPAVAEALYRIRRADRLSGQTDFALVKDITPAEEAGIASLRRFSYRPVETDPNMVLELQPHWRTYDDYLASLDGKYRKSARQIAKAIEAAGCRVELLRDLDASAEHLYSLYLQVQANNALRLVTVPPAFLPSLARNAGENFRCSVVRRGADIIGFVTTLKDGDTAVGYQIGFDRIAVGELPIYLRLLHATVADAIALGCRRLSLGRTALEPKARLGARPEPMQVWLRHRAPAMNLILRNLLAAIPHDEAPDRNPFKAAEKEPDT
jgi:predicted N-acyltransferase